jgi:hypothetical protein
VGGILTRSELANVHSAGVPHASARVVEPEVEPAGLGTLEAMASMAGQTGSVVHVVVARQPGIVDTAHAVAQFAGIGVSVDVMPTTVRVRFDGSQASGGL